MRGLNTNLVKTQIIFQVIEIVLEILNVTLDILKFWSLSEKLFHIVFVDLISHFLDFVALL